MLQPKAVPAPSGTLTILHRPGSALRAAALDGRLIRDDTHGHYWRHRSGLLLHRARRLTPIQQRVLAWLRDHVHEGLPRAWYKLVLGHDLHVSIFATLHLRHFHAEQPDPFTGRLGWWENVGLVSQGKVTTAYRDYTVDNLITELTAFGDFKYHEVGTSTQAEANTDTALIATSGIARATGTQVEAAADQYRSVATVTADATETWNEHGLFNASTSGILLDRSVLASPPDVIANDTVEFTHTTTFNAEA